MACTCGGHNEALFAQLDEVIEQHKDMRGSLISVLHKAQGIFGYLPEEVQAYIAEKMDVPLSEIYGVVTFYALFTMKKKGKYTFNVCLGTACYVKGSGKLLDKLQEELGIGVGETTADGLFTIEACRCVGACGLAPVVTVNDKVYGHLKPEDITKMIADFKAAEQN
ncbi:MAG: NAD(P)H-dependent oxidoreductase subunit E [Peptococcaceae bacterium]|mgnify:FL=1|jgi:NADH:ubiquinone oxidoreductase subunit E|nr:NAD(P)H-dependent oxidoreductase subunit E [Peptococcaceae bacterium]MBQ2448453.1 NAD(P)H-dependent oxidoreductase subunit E [Peptococcaceae bacterium]MBQ5615292.1 NAD(P)H-dependent oxidoreductase subunit E [Peptococcaceae bacterium]MBQ5659319.1 NAD(P)H-dependent oxidoreductase subunit E [Peptococcaceae bacterium]MBQ5707876.1 NAD(P)H-dependent oxidoreductase subunit E [Peptococcaceae bacterium]